ncbi:hypothetical protein JCM10213_008404 [Rhodosporidiobolus nylandii]
MSHELSVEGDKVLEKDEAGNVISSKDYTRVHAGYVAASHNKRLPEETRHAQLAHDLAVAHGDEDKAGEQPSKPAVQEGGSHKHSHDHSRNTHPGVSDEVHNQQVHEHHVIGGLKATISNPNTSAEAKERAKEKLEEMGVDPSTI